jgi:hypothetical protein
VAPEVEQEGNVVNLGKPIREPMEVPEEEQLPTEPIPAEPVPEREKEPV